MIRVGDVISRFRAVAPDPCGVLPAPLAPTLSQIAGGSLPTGSNIYVVQTWQTPWGETEPSPEEIISLGGGNATLVIANTVVPGATKMGVYFGPKAGFEAFYVEYDLVAANIGAGQTATISIPSLAAVGGKIAPTINRAYLMDSDGGYVSASLAFSWLNKALSKMVVDLGGIRDLSGIAWPAGNAWAILQNRWTEIENAWWGGWYQQIGRQEYTWLVNPVSSIPGYVTSWSNAGQDVMGAWPQPAQGPATTNLLMAMGITDLVANVDAITVGSPPSFQLPGLIQIDDEIMLASTTSNPVGSSQNISGILRGQAGTVATTHQVGAPVTQLIMLFTGTRLAPQFYPGSAYALLQLPAGWDAPLDKYLLARYKEKEQEIQEAQLLDQSFQADIEVLRSSRDAVPKNRAIGDSRVFEAFAGYRSGYPFGILIP